MPACFEAVTSPIASATLPEMFRYVPFSYFAGGTVYCERKSSVDSAERVGVDDDDAVGRHVLQVDHQGRRIERDEDVRPVARRVDVSRGELNPEAGDARERAGRSADLGREIRERRLVVAQGRRR